MANQEHVDLLKQGIDAWNKWREQHPAIRPDLCEAILSEGDLNGVNLSKALLEKVELSRANLIEADLSGASLSRALLVGTNFSKANLITANLNDAFLIGAYLSEADLSRADLRGADLSRAYLMGARLSRANFKGARLSRAYLNNADLSQANLSGAELSEANLSEADLSRADLRGANVSRAILVGTNLAETNLTNCRIYGIAAWGVKLEGAIQNNLIITPWDEPTITVDNLEVAQFIYLLLNNPKIRDVIDTIAKKAVLILGRFTSERKAILDALREALRICGYLPILFDFEKPSSQDLTETITTLAHLSRFIIADLTDPSCIPYELHAVVPNRMVPVLPLIKESIDPITGKPIREFAMFRDLRQKYHWVLPTYRYQDLANLLASLESKVIKPAEQKAQELEKR